jgi:hypothetical protein
LEIAKLNIADQRTKHKAPSTKRKLSLTVPRGSRYIVIP